MVKENILKKCIFQKNFFFFKIRSSDAVWEYGTVLLEAPPDITEFRVVMVAERHDSKNGFVAVDEFEFIENDKCVLNPPQADPNAPTTVEPTEPPGRKYYLKLYFKLLGNKISKNICQITWYLKNVLLNSRDNMQLRN